MNVHKCCSREDSECLCVSASMVNNRGRMIASVDMCFFCFDVLNSHLNQYDPPTPPQFPNEC